VSGGILSRDGKPCAPVIRCRRLTLRSATDFSQREKHHQLSRRLAAGRLTR